MRNILSNRIAELAKIVTPRIVVLLLSLQMSGTTWDVSPDPNRFLVELTTATGGSTLVMVTDWFDELRRLAPSKR